MKLNFITTIACLLLAATAIVSGQDDEARKHQLHSLGGPYFVSRNKVQDELKLTDDQRQKVRGKLSGDIRETKEVFERLKGLKGNEREKAMQPFYEKLESFLKEVLTADQFKRFEQLKLQYDTPGTMLRPVIVKELNITDEQRRQFTGAIQEMQRTIEPLLKDAKSGGNPQEILLKVTKLRQDCQGQIVALLNDAQKKQWQEMTGKPFVIW